MAKVANNITELIGRTPLLELTKIDVQDMACDFFVFSGHKNYGPSGIAVRAGHHCAQPALRALGYEMSVRPTFAVYNTREEVDRLVIALRKIVGTTR